MFTQLKLRCAFEMPTLFLRIVQRAVRHSGHHSYTKSLPYKKIVYAIIKPKKPQCATQRAGTPDNIERRQIELGLSL